MNIQKDTKKKPENPEVIEPNKVKVLLDGLSKGECKGVKGATAYKIAAYAQQKGLV